MNIFKKLFGKNKNEPEKVTDAPSPNMNTGIDSASDVAERFDIFGNGSGNMGETVLLNNGNQGETVPLNSGGETFGYSNFGNSFGETVLLSGEPQPESASSVADDTSGHANLGNSFGETVLLSDDSDFYGYSGSGGNSGETVLLGADGNSPVGVFQNGGTNERPISVADVLKETFLINPMTGEKIKVDKQIFTVGSGDSVDYKIVKPDISGNHASIFIKGIDEIYITDNGSTNGTEINGVHIDSMKMVPVENGDLVTFGSTLFQLYIEK